MVSGFSTGVLRVLFCSLVFAAGASLKLLLAMFFNGVFLAGDVGVLVLGLLWGLEPWCGLLILVAGATVLLRCYGVFWNSIMVFSGNVFCPS